MDVGGIVVNICDESKKKSLKGVWASKV